MQFEDDINMRIFVENIKKFLQEINITFCVFDNLLFLEIDKLKFVI